MPEKLSVFLDLDGVLVDYLTGIREALKMPIESIEYFINHPEQYTLDLFDEAMGGEEKRKEIQNSLPFDFWYNLQKFPWADELITKLKANFPLCFLTSPGLSVESPKGKSKWQRDYYADIPIIIARNKWLIAGPNKALIDDDEFQSSSFNKHGGVSVKWTNQFLLTTFTPAQVTTYIDEIVEGLKKYEKDYLK